MNQFEIMLEALKLLNDKLKKSGISISLTIVGSMAVYLNGIKLERYTEDVDFIGFEPNEAFDKKVLEVASELGLKDDWINARADSIKPLPKGLEENTLEDNRFSHITLYIVKKEYLIKMKIYAAYIRGQEKDFEDLMSLNPTKENINSGIEYIKESVFHHHGKSQLEKDNDEIESFKKDLYARFC